MKSDVVFGLENAGWPALLLDATSTICRANFMAADLFGAALECDFPRLSAIWAPENQGTAEQFLALWECSPVATALLHLREKDGRTGSYFTAICAFTSDGQKYFVFQFPPQNGGLALDARNSGGNTEVVHKQKLDCALQLTRTVALDFNNALTSILGHTSLVLSKMEPDHPWRGSLLEVAKSAAKAAEIAKDLGTFSCQEKETRVQAAGNLNLLLQHSVESLQQNARPAGVIWTLQLERRLFAAKFDEDKMQQVFVKIMENSIQSFRDGNGRIILQTRNIELTQSTQDRNARLAAGAYVCVEISDNGCGIEPDVLPRIFEPFFTTRGGEHRGLGLAWVYGIITNHGGGVAVSSQPGTGTSVRVYLPAEKTIVQDNGMTSENDLRGTQTILFVDDEDLLLTMGQTILSAYGYRVLTANSGQQALEILSRKDPQVDLVITDLVMPAMSGRELVERILALRPSARILCTSGFIWPAGQEKDAAYLQKPFTTQELLLKVKNVLALERAT